jgi:hypothetical protein
MEETPMHGPGEQGSSSSDADAPGLRPAASAHGDAAAPRHGSIVGRVIPVVFILAALAAATAVALGAGAVTLPGTGTAKVSTQQAAAAREIAANQRWASATCTTVVSWKNDIHRDLHGLTFSLDAIPRLQDAIAATTRMAHSIETLGLPPALQAAHGRAQLDQLRSDVQSHLHGIESAASSVAGGDLGAIGTLLNDLANARSMESQITGRLRDVASELGVSLASSPSCQQLVGFKS